MYTFKKNISLNEYDEYIKNYSTASFMQDYRWTKVKDNFDNILCGIYEDDKLVVAFSALIRELPLKLKLMYIPRGPLMDFSNLELVKCLEKNLRKLAKEYNTYAVTIEPNFCNTELSIKEIRSNKKTDSPVNYSNNFETFHRNLEMCNFKHQGFERGFIKTYQPRFNMVIPLCDKDNNIQTLDEVLAGFKSKVRYYLGSFHQKRGVYFERTSDINRLDDFVKMLSFTEERQNISLRDKSYYEKILNEFKDRAVLFFGYVDLKVYLEYLENNKGKENEINEVKELMCDNDKLLMSASLTILPSNKGIRMSDYIYAGNNLLLPGLRISTAMVYEIMKMSIEENCHYCNLGGVDGNLDDHLSIFKEKFNPIVFEYIGEYDLIINKTKYFLAKHCITSFKDIRLKIRKMKKNKI